MNWNRYAARKVWGYYAKPVKRKAGKALAPAQCSACGGKPIQSRWSTGKYYVGCNSCPSKTPPGGTETAEEAWRLWNEMNTPNESSSHTAHD